MLRDGTNRERLELIRTRDGLTDAVHAELLAAVAGWRTLLRLVWRHPDAAVRLAGLNLVADAGLLGEGPAVLGALDDPKPDVRDAAAAAAVALADAADAAIRAGGGDEPGRRAFVAALAAHLVTEGPQSDAAAGWLAVAAAGGDEELAAVSADSIAGPKLDAALQSARHPGAARTLLGLLSLRRPPRSAVRAAQRTDAGFLIPLLKTVARAGAGSLPGLPPLAWLADAGRPARRDAARPANGDRGARRPCLRARRQSTGGATVVDRPGHRGGPAGGGTGASRTARGREVAGAQYGSRLAGRGRGGVGRGTPGRPPGAGLAAPAVGVVLTRQRGGAGRRRRRPAGRRRRDRRSPRPATLRRPHRRSHDGSPSPPHERHICSSSDGSASVTRCTLPSPSTQASTVRPVAISSSPRRSS